MTTKSLIEKAREIAMESIFLEMEDQTEKIASLKWAVSTWKGWKKWYCKKNQPGNYIRLMCRKPAEFKDVPYAWNCRLQLFIKGELDTDIRIDAEAYRLFPMNDEWGPLETQFDYEFRIYRNKNI